MTDRKDDNLKDETKGKRADGPSMPDRPSAMKDADGEDTKPKDSANHQGTAHKAIEAASRTAAEAAGAMGHEAQKFAKEIQQQIAEGTSVTALEWSRDKYDARMLFEKRKWQVKRIGHDITHPKDLAKDVKAVFVRGESKAEHVGYDVMHPEKDAQRLERRVEKDVDAARDVKKQIVADLDAPIDSKKLPVAMKVLGVLCILASMYNIWAVGDSILRAVGLFQSGGMSGDGLSTIIVTFVELGLHALLLAMFFIFGLRLLRNKRRMAALACDVIFVVLFAAMLCSVMLHGISAYLVFYGLACVLMIVLQTHLDPSLSGERALRRKLRDMETRKEAEEGTLGLDITGRGYITLNFFNLFWIFVVCSMLGLGIEELFHVLVVDPGHVQDRAGLLFGPFSPIYGCGALLMTICLNRFHKKNFIIIFFVAAVIGGAFEYFTSVFMQYAFGAVAWDYTGMWLSIGGRTCGLFMAMWGVLGVVWIKLLLPLMLRIINLIPWNWRYAVTAVAASLMVVDIVMTLQSLDCWYERLSGNPVNTPIQHFYADHFNNTYMSDRFQSMSIIPHDAVRGGK